MGNRCLLPSPLWKRTKTGNLLASPYSFKKYGQSGIEVSELFPNVGLLHRRHLRDPFHAGGQHQTITAHASR